MSLVPPMFIALRLFFVGAAAVSVVLPDVGAAAASVVPTDVLWLHSSSLSVAISKSTGRVQHINASDGWSRDTVGSTWVTDSPGGEMRQFSLSVEPEGKSVVVRRSVQVQGYGSSARQTFNASLVDIFTAADRSVGGIIWNQSIATSSDQPWRAAVGTELNFAPSPGDSKTQFWLPRNGKMTDDVLRMRSASDLPFYVELGQGYYKEAAKGLDQMPFPAFLWSGFGEGGGGGLIVTPRLNDSTLAATARLNSSSLLFQRFYNRLDAAHDTSFLTHLDALRPPSPAAVSLGNDDAWRDALRFAAAVNPDVFSPVQESSTPAGQARAVSTVGMGLYTCARAIDVNISTTVDGAGATTLWDASFWWPYIGLFLPPVADTTTMWRSNTGVGEQKICSKQPRCFPVPFLTRPFPIHSSRAPYPYLHHHHLLPIHQYSGGSRLHSRPGCVGSAD
jgi:hypothetical protein